MNKYTEEANEDTEETPRETIVKKKKKKKKPQAGNYFVTKTCLLKDKGTNFGTIMNKNVEGIIPTNNITLIAI